jgi:hypothetical protein
LSTDIITTYPHGFKVTPYGSARIEIRHNYEKRVGTEAEPFYLVAAFISCMVDETQRETFALLKDEERAEIAKEWFLSSLGDYRAIGEEPNVVY